jgi:hypothetical protein
MDFDLVVGLAAVAEDRQNDKLRLDRAVSIVHVPSARAAGARLPPFLAS